MSTVAGGRGAARTSAELADVFAAFRVATGCAAAIVHAPQAGYPAAPGVRHRPDAGAVVVARLAGAAPRWLVVGPCRADGGAFGSPEAHLDFLLPLVARQLQSDADVEQAAAELSERYEEINLLYTISEILGRAVTLEDTAGTILTEVSETVGARRAAILVHDAEHEKLRPIAAFGFPLGALAPVAASDPRSTPARVFRTLQPTIDDADASAAGDEPLRDGAVLCVPIVWSAPDGNEPIGVVALSGRRAGQQFTAGDLKLVAAIASQIAAAIQNARLVTVSIAQERLAREMALAHDLQMSLLPRAGVVAPDAQAAARVVPAESVGGDFYQLVRLSGGRTGVMIGDVSSHGYRAALIMALSMSAAAIHAQHSADPGATMAAVLGSLGDELTSTEMFISAVYAVVDPRRGELRYANAGHPHAFVVRANGGCERLPAATPPLGMVELAPPAVRTAWCPREDLLVAFTDGITEARDPGGRMLGEDAVLEVVRAARAESPDEIVARVFARLEVHTGGARPSDDLTLVVVRS